jgi:hypothetical protein
MKARKKVSPFEPGWKTPEPCFDFRTHGYFPRRGRKQFVISDLLALEEISVVYGEPEAGKGNFVLSMALAAANGMTWFGRDAGVLRDDGLWWPAGVLYFALERAAQVERRINAFTTHHGIMSDIPIAVSDAKFDIREDRAASMIVETVYEAHDCFECSKLPGETDRLSDYQPETNLVIIDTLAMALADGNDSDPGDLGQAIRTCHRIKDETGAHVLLVTHTPTSGDARIRGHGSLNAAIDLSIHVDQKRGSRVASVKKNSDGAEKPKFYFSLKNIQEPVMWDDEESDFVTISPAPILVEEEPPKASDKPKGEGKPKGPLPSKGEQPVLHALAVCAEPVAEDVWRAAYDAAKDEDISPGTHRTRFSRGKVALVAKGLIKQDEAGLWSVTVSPLQSENCNSEIL